MRRRCGLTSNYSDHLLLLCRIAVLRTVDVVHCYRCSVLCLSVGLSVTIVNPAKTAEPIEIPFGLCTLVGPRNHVINGVLDSPIRRGNFGGRDGQL